MQDTAREMNLSATAYLRRQDDGFDLRWFTPTVEIALCGHGTLASAHVLWEMGQLAGDGRGALLYAERFATARRVGDWIELDFPARHALKTEAPDGLERALGASARYVGRNALDYLVEVESEKVLRGLQPDFAL